MLDKTIMNDNIDQLVSEGEMLSISLFKLSQEGLNSLKKQNVDPTVLPDFNSDYESWYTKCYNLIHMVANYRLSDFVSLYKCENRKTLSIENYCIMDALWGRIWSRGDKVIAEPKDIISKVRMQVKIVASLKTIINDYFYNLNTEIEYDVFDSELDSAYELLKKKFLRSAGVIAGVLLEKHLLNVCNAHSIKIAKKEPTLSDLYNILKDNAIIDLAMWRKLQYLGDIRNLCCHNKGADPTDTQVKDLLDGTKYVLNNII